MSSLGTSLLLLAAIALVVVLGYNLWLGRSRAAGARALGRRGSAPAAGSKSADRGNTAGRDDASRGEPSFGADGMPVDAGGSGSQGPSGLAPGDARGEPFAPGAHVPGASPAARAPAGPILGDLTDCIVELELPSALPGERLIHFTMGRRRAGSKPIVVEAASSAESPAHDGDVADVESATPAEPAGVDEPMEPAWEPLRPGRQYDLVRVGILLANRHGPLNAMEFSEFVAGVHALADQLSVLADTPDMTGVLARARELDETCAQLDAQVGLGVEAPETLGVADLARLAAETSCAERGNNRYARLGPNGEVLFSLALADAPNRLSLLLDVPRAPAAQGPWREMVACARLCAQRLGGVLVDDAARPLADAHLGRIEQQIAMRQQALADAGLAPGSPLALRLFN